MLESKESNRAEFSGRTGLLVSPEPYSTVPAAFMAVLLVGMIIARISVMPIAVEGRFDEKRGLVLSIGLSMLLMNLALAIFGPEYRSVPGAFVTGAVNVGPLTLEGQRLVLLAGSLILTFLLFLFLRYSVIGLAVRATAENPAAAQASGINIGRMQLVTFAIGSALAGAGGALIAPVSYAYPAMGTQFILYAFIVVIVGGLGSVWGAFVVGYLLGIAESLSVLFLPSGYNALIGPVLMLIVLIFRPQGLFGRAERLA